MARGVKVHGAILSLAAVLAAAACEIAPKNAPWAPLSLEDPIGWTTRMKLSGLTENPRACRAALATALELRFRDAAPDAGTLCPLREAVAIQTSTISYGQELAASCRLAAAIYIWEREVVQPAAQLHLKTNVARIDTFGTFACRNIYSRADDRRSEHASANALDVAGFRLEDRRRVSVLHDWSGEGEGAAFLRQVRDGSCRVFNGVLSPEYNAAHANHLHLDMGPYRICS